MICLTFAIPVNENHCLIGMENVPSPAGWFLRPSGRVCIVPTGDGYSVFKVLPYK